MHITNLVVRELGLTNVVELEPYATINGVTIVELQATEGHFRVHLVRDSQYLNVKLEEGAKLAAYYNSLFWHEASADEKIRVSSAHFKTAFRVSDGDVKHSVFITTIGGAAAEARRRRRLGLAELEQCAKEIATLHAVNSRLVTSEFETAVQENYGNIRAYRKKIRADVVEILELAINNEISQFFVKPAKVMEKVAILVHHLEQEERNGRRRGEGQEAEEDEEQVITHGRLTADTCRFDEHGKLVEITEWENIHLGNPAEDLTNLIVSSASTKLRKYRFMKVFQVYFYTLVDLRPPNYQLSDLKRWFRELQPKTVVDGIEALLLFLSESPDEIQKRDAARRWESALDDAVDFLTGNYVSDDEQVFFSSQKGDEEPDEPDEE